LLSPQTMYDLVLAASDDEELALQTKVQYELNSMPEHS